MQSLLPDPLTRGDASPLPCRRQPSCGRRTQACNLSWLRRADRRLVPGLDRARARQFNWGFVLLQKGLAPRRLTNVRDDKILTSKFWRPSFEQRRCLVPASSYCEPKGEKPATWHWFAVNGEEERSLFAFPGVWTRYRGPLKKNGDNVDQEVFAFMTTEPNELAQSINHERMPVLMSDPDDFETWLSGSTEEAFKLARSYAAEQMRIVQSGAVREDLLRVA